MKSSTLFQLLLFLCVVSLGHAQKTIEVPLQLVDGFGSFVAYADIVKRRPPDDKYAQLELEAKGIPQNWKDPFVENIQFDPHQFHYQNYQKGLIDEEWFKGMKIDLSSRYFSKEPIRCFAYMVVGKNESGNWVYKIDTDNDLDFSNNRERDVPAIAGQWSAELVDQHKVMVRHEAVVEGKVVPMESPVLFRLIPKRGLLIRNFPQHAVAQFRGKRIHLSSNNFTSTSYDHVRFIIEGETHEITEGQVDILSVGDQKYRVLGVKIDQRKLMLQEILETDSIFPPEVGYPVFPIAGKDFATGDSLNITDYKGKFVFIEFWGTWCNNCLKAFPTLQSVYSQIDTTKIDFLGIAVDSPTDGIRRILDREAITWKQVQVEEQSPLVKNYKLDREGYPFSLLLDKDGKILQRRPPLGELLQTIKALE